MLSEILKPDSIVFAAFLKFRTDMGQTGNAYEHAGLGLSTSALSVLYCSLAFRKMSHTSSFFIIVIKYPYNNSLRQKGFILPYSLREVQHCQENLAVEA